LLTKDWNLYGQFVIFCQIHPRIEHGMIYCIQMISLLKSCFSV
jgi:hypothetical protein